MYLCHGKQIVLLFRREGGCRMSLPTKQKIQKRKQEIMYFDFVSPLE